MPIGHRLDQPIRGLYLVEPGGMLNLGPAYGKVKVGGLSLEEATEAVTKHLRRMLKDPQVSLTLNESGGQQQIAGEHLVGPDGTINLGTYGQVYVAGMTIQRSQRGHRRAPDAVFGSAARSRSMCLPTTARCIT